MGRRNKRIKYEFAPDIEEKVREIVGKLGMSHVKIDDVRCVRSRGSKSRGTIARCHGLSKIMQLCLGRKAFYVLEFLSEKFDKLSEELKRNIINGAASKDTLSQV